MIFANVVVIWKNDKIRQSDISTRILEFILVMLTAFRWYTIKRIIMKFVQSRQKTHSSEIIGNFPATVICIVKAKIGHFGYSRSDLNEMNTFIRKQYSLGTGQ